MRANGLPAAGVVNPDYGAPVYPAGPPTIANGARMLDRYGNPTIDPVTGGFVKVDPVMMRVYLAVRTSLASASADKKLGCGLPKKAGKRFEAELRTAVQTALTQLIQSKTIAFNSATPTQIRPGTYGVEVDYTNLLNGARRQVIV